MHIMYCDETNLEERSGIFFTYGGLAIEANQLPAFSQSIEDIRSDFRIDPDFILKFNPGPKHLSHADHISLKKAIIEAAVANGCILLTSFILHDIATNPQEARRNEISRVCYHFDCLLSHKDSNGLVLIDRFTDKEIDHHLREKFSIGITNLPYSSTLRLNRIVGFHYSAIGQAHMCSVVDIVLGSIRHAINIFEDQEKRPTAETLIRQVAPMYYRDTIETNKASEISLFFSPKVIRVQKYREKYERLHGFLGECDMSPKQLITDYRTY